MEASPWTDARIDDLNARVDKMSDRIDKMGDRVDALQHAIIVVGGGLFAAFVAFLAAMAGLIVTLLLIHF
jgi:hypothetical protein